MFPLPTNDQMEMLAAQFNQNPNWEHGNMPLTLSDIEETTPNDITISSPKKIGPGIIKEGHRFLPERHHGYPIDGRGVHPDSEHHIFLVRHGLYLNTEDDASSHLLRYGKYQARMAGDKLNYIIRDIIEKIGPLTRPIKLVSSTQTRAFETLYNIRLQLSNDFPYETEFIQDTGLTECVDINKIRLRWMYFVREYLQPIKSDEREHTITIIASHGNLLTSFSYIINNFIHENQPYNTFHHFNFPISTGVTHAGILYYKTYGSEPITQRSYMRQDEIPITVNHAQLGRDWLYEWAAQHQCRSNYGLDNMERYIAAAITRLVFSVDNFRNSLPNYVDILHMEMVEEYETHILPMLMHTCRTYLYHLSLMRTNTEFQSFHRLMSPVPIPESEAEQGTPVSPPTDRFSAYALPYPVDNSILGFAGNGDFHLAWLSPDIVNPESRKLIFLLRHDK
ncbi:hypothetical protein I4U23_029837 [Adineta vaga]|nr:hypothetical protein I4U23_029837 [Adineta vaga]